MSEQIIGAGKEEGNTYEDDFVRRNLNDLKRQVSRLTQLAELEIPEKINGLNIRLEENKTEYVGITERLALVLRSSEHIRDSVDEANTRVDAVDNRLLRTQADLTNFEYVKPDELSELIERLNFLQSDNSAITQRIDALLENLADVRASIPPLGDRLRVFETEFKRLENRIQAVERLEDSVTKVLSNEIETRLAPVEDQLRTLLDNFSQVRKEVGSLATEQVEIGRVVGEVTSRTVKIESLEARLNEIGVTVDAEIRQIAELIEEDKKIMSSQYVLGDRIETVHQEILSLIDQIASEFKRFNTQQEGQRRRQIQTLSQDLRESTFHNLHPPSES
ncbi:MAG: hypothetical protein MKZ84_01115 [Dehalococcoidia bacterium]|nr:hypothetical protein [Dehalococcoidia bacterium]